MRRSTIRICLVVVGALHFGLPPAAGQLAPSAFPALPQAIRDELERRQCSIPQVPSDTTPQNVVQGHFRRSTQVDWAVLCAVHGYSSILVFWNGAAPRHPSEVAVATDAEYLQTVAGGPPIFARTIALEDAARIPQPQPVPITHDGIRNLGPGKASLIYYWDDRRDKWVTLTSGD
ncbi:MAG TPA: hypothetical protein VLV16_10035 [Gemmatimonadales bacterium]|nr:hypothetical protein [Gemmatimonadales bacterium]